MNKRGVPAGCVSGRDDQEDEQMKADVLAGKFQILFFTPEALLMNKRWRQLIKSEQYQERIKGLVVDEAHTVIKWSVTVHTNNYMMRITVILYIS